MYLPQHFFTIKFILIIYFNHVNKAYKIPEESRTCSGVIYVKEKISGDRTKRGIFINRWANWTKDIKYYIHKDIYRSKIISVFNFLMRETCLKFEESKKQKINKSLIEFIRSNSFCLSEIGKRSTNNNTKIQLTDFCSRQFGTVGHEVLHALGVGHEQQRSDRNKYVKINDNNIKSGYERNFKKHDNYNWMSFEIPYDYASIMHYKKNALSKNGKNTLKAKNIELFNDMMGHESVFSFNDIKLVNYYYCRNECSFSKMVCKNGGYVRDPNCNICVCPKEYEGSDCSKVKNRSYSCTLQTLHANEKISLISSFGKKRCVFHIRSLSGKRIGLFISIVNTLKKKICVSDVGLDVKYLNDKGVTGLCLCGIYENLKIYSESSEILLTFTGSKDDHMFIAYYNEITLSDDIKSVLCYNNKCYKNNELLE